MMETHHDFLFGDAHFFELFVNFNIGVIFLDPYFSILDVKLKYSVINPSFSFPTNP